MKPLCVRCTAAGRHYGHGFAEVWFDGGYPAVLRDGIADLIDRHQPSAVAFQGPNYRPGSSGKAKGGGTGGEGGEGARGGLHSGNAVRWAGTESGHTPSDDMWSTVRAAGPGASGSSFGYGPGSPNGTVFMPAEQDSAIQSGANEGGFWYPGERSKPVDELVNEYEDSVGHNSNYMLELSPDRHGALPDADLAAYRGLGAALSECYGGAKAVARTGANCSSAACDVPLPALTGNVDRVLIQVNGRTTTTTAAAAAAAAAAATHTRAHTHTRTHARAPCGFGRGCHRARNERQKT